MAYYLRWPANAGSTTTNNKCAEITGLISTGTTNFNIVFADVVTTDIYAGIVDFRRKPDEKVSSADGGYYFINPPSSVALYMSNPKKNGVASTLTAITTCVADDSFSFDCLRIAPTGAAILGGRYSENYGWPNLAIKRVIITDSRGVHTLDMSSSNGTLSEIVSDTGLITMKLKNFVGTSQWVFYDAGGGVAEHQSSGASALQLCSAVATTTPLNSQQKNTGAVAAQVFNAAATSEPVNGQQQQTAGSAAQKFSAAATALQENSQNRQSTGQVVSVAGFIASTSWVNTVNLGNVQNRQTSGSAVQAFSAQATVTKTNKQHRQSGGQVSAATTFAASSSWVNAVLQIAAYTQQIKTRSISKKHYQTSTRHSYHIQSRSNHKIELTTQSGGVYMQEINFKQGASALLVIDHQIDNEQVAGINAAKYELYGRTGQVLITKELGSGIAFNSGKIEIQLTDTDTAELSGNYNHQCVAKDLADRTFYPLNGDITFSATKPRL